jgi:hypothetical protein
MRATCQQDTNGLEMDTPIAADVGQLLRAIAEAADAANAEYLALRAVASTRPEEIAAVQRRWLLLEQQRRKLAAARH